MNEIEEKIQDLVNLQLINVFTSNSTGFGWKFYEKSLNKISYGLTEFIFLKTNRTVYQKVGIREILNLFKII